jgi:dedicated sortase system histidine kinase
MTLRHQLLLVCLLTLVLPWAGCQFIRETESALREGQQQMLAGTAQAIADSLAQFPAEFLRDRLNTGAGDAVYAHPLASPPLLDGYFVDWGLSGEALVPIGEAESQVRYALGIHRAYLFLYVTVGENMRSATPEALQGHPHRIALVTTDGAGRSARFRFEPEAPGRLVAERFDGQRSSAESRITAHWQDAASGYRLEARIPREMLERTLGIEVSHGALNGAAAASVATFPGSTPGPLVTPSPVLESVTTGYAQPGLRLIVTDRAGWRLATAGALAREAAAGEGNDAISGWLRIAYDALLEPGNEAALAEPDPTGREAEQYVRRALGGEAATSWFRSGRSGRAVVAVAQPVWSGNVQTGAVILQQGTDAILSLTNRALTRLMNVTVLATLVVGAALLGYASWLSFRIRRLSNAALQALEREPARTELPSTNAADEIGDLSRSFTSVLRQLGEYNEYLRTLASKLSHEMRTPLTIVMSSLENLEHEPPNAETAEYIARARSGALRLQKILAAMSEASRVEELIENAEPERFDLDAVLTTTVAAYGDAWPHRRFTYAVPGSRALVDGSPELIVQMLDKLVDNAVDFSAEGDEILLGLSVSDREAVISVHNPGPPLPARMRSQLFDSMVSVRGEGADRHLGLGLFIARLIAVGHGGSITASDADAGVTFEVHVPLADG